MDDAWCGCETHGQLGLVVEVTSFTREELDLADRVVPADGESWRWLLVTTRLADGDASAGLGWIHLAAGQATSKRYSTRWTGGCDVGVGRRMQVIAYGVQ